MILPESEAKTKRCCGPEGCGDVRVGYHPNVDLGMPAPTGPRYCIGSACMGWAWDKSPEQTTAIVPRADFAGVRYEIVQDNRPPSGHCGLVVSP